MIYVTYVRVRGHVLENEIVAGVFPPVADDNEYIALCHLRDLKPLLLLYNTIQSSHVCSMVESRVLQSKVNLKKINIPAKFQMAIKLNLHILKIIFICKLSHHLQILLIFIVFLIMI